MVRGLHVVLQHEASAPGFTDVQMWRCTRERGRRGGRGSQPAARLPTSKGKSGGLSGGGILEMLRQVSAPRSPSKTV